MKLGSPLILVLAALAGTLRAQSTSGAASKEPAVLVKPAVSISPEKEKEILRLLDLTGQTRFLDQVLDPVGRFAKAEGIDELPPLTSAELHQKLSRAEALKVVIPIYDRYFTLDELKAANAFYSSPAGRRIAQAVPQASLEAKNAWQQWGQFVLQQVRAAKENSAKIQTQGGAK